MKKLFERKLKRILKSLATRIIQKYKPGIIGVTGSVGKTSAKEAIATVLRTVRTVRKSYGNFNNEIGLPLTIIGDYKETGGLFFWFRVFMDAYRLLLSKRPYPELLILEYAADRPGDIQYLLEIARPHLGVVTGIGRIPAHGEFYTSVDEVVREKGRLIDAVPANSFAAIHSDDPSTKPIIDRAKAHVITYGISEHAEVRILSFETRFIKDRPVGISFKIAHGSNFIPVRIDGVLGMGPAYAAAAAASIAGAFGMNLLRIADALHYYTPLPGRSRLLDAANGATIIDDSYNASPLSMKEALAALKACKGARRVAVLGDMRELGRESERAHEEVGQLAVKSSDLLITVGPEAHIIANAAFRGGIPKKRLLRFESVDELLPQLPELIKPTDVVLVKASHAIGLEKVVEALRKR